MINSSALLEINTKNFAHNYKSLSKVAKHSLAGATIKANAYGLGDNEIYKILYKNGCRHFFVATFYEALKLKKKSNNKSLIFVLNGIENYNLKKIYKNKIIPILNSLKDLNQYEKRNKRNKFKIPVGIHIDSGINRLGIKIDELKKHKFRNLKLLLLMSHLSSADQKNSYFNKFQNTNFTYSFKYFPKPRYKSLSNSMGILLGNKYHYDLIRPGISLYGGYIGTKMKKIIKPVIKLKAKILQIKKLNKNEFVGYNNTYKTSKYTTIAILGIGYGDGIFRCLSNKGYVFYKKNKFKIIGRISMDSITVDITKHKKMIKEGEYMELINYEYDIEKMAKICGTISNEILTSITNRVKRIYI